MLVLEGYRIAYPGGPTLSYPDLRVARGELAGLFGPSGCGKTSLLESLFNASFPGRISCRRALLGGVPLPLPGPSLYCRASYCPQFSQAALNPKLTLRAHIHLVLRGNGLAERDADLPGLLARLRLDEELLSRRPGGLSGGQQQRMVLLLCALKKPDLLVLDEPSSAIDLITLRDMVGFLDHLKGSTAILMAAHSRPLLERAADRIIEL